MKNLIVHSPKASTECDRIYCLISKTLVPVHTRERRSSKNTHNHNTLCSRQIGEMILFKDRPSLTAFPPPKPLVNRRLIRRTSTFFPDPSSSSAAFSGFLSQFTSKNSSIAFEIRPIVVSRVRAWSSSTKVTDVRFAKSELSKMGARKSSSHETGEARTERERAHWDTFSPLFSRGIFMKRVFQSNRDVWGRVNRHPLTSSISRHECSGPYLGRQR